MTVAILDSFSTGSTPHGVRVEREVRDVGFRGTIRRYDYAANRLPWRDIAKGVEWALREVDDLTAINLSWGGGTTDDPDDAVPIFEDLFAQAEARGIDVFTSAGNHGRTLSGVSRLAAHPYSWCVGASMDGETIADFSGHWPRLTDAIARGPWGTSGSAPRMCGAIAKIREDHGLSPIQARCLFHATAHPIAFTDENPPRKFHYWHLDTPALYEAAREGVKITPSLVIRYAYCAYAGRHPDDLGLRWWTRQAERFGTGLAIEDLVRSLRRYGDWMADECPVLDRIIALYVLHFDRLPDAPGLRYWTEQVMAVDNDAGTFGIRDLKPSDTLFTTTGPITNWRDLSDALVTSAADNERIRHEFALDLMD